MKRVRLAKTRPHNRFLIQGIIIFLLTIQSTSSSAQWTRVSDALRKRAECPSVLYQGKIYVFGGFGEHPNFEKDNEVYDPVSNTWSLIAPFPAGKEISHQGFVLVDDKIWHIGGRAVDADGPVSSQVIIYNITNNTWSNGPELKDPATGQSLTLGGGGAALVGRTLHVFGGFSPTICVDQNKYHLTLDVDKLNSDPFNTSWENKLPVMPFPRNHLSTVVLGGKIYALGGQFGHDCSGADQKYCDVYDPVANTWTRLTDLPSPRSHCEMATFSVDGKIFMIGGQGPSGVAQNTVYIFSPSDNNGLGSWTDAPQYQLPNVYYGISSKVIGNKFIISHGALTTVTNERIETYSAPIARNTPYQLGFTKQCFDKITGPTQKLVVKNILYTIEGQTQYNLTSNAAWLTISTNQTGLAIQSGVDVEATIDPAGLADGNYSATITATGTGAAPAYTGTSFCVNLTVSSATPTLTVTVNGNGTAVKNPTQASYVPGSVVTLTATPGTGHYFAGWSGDTAATDNPLSITMGTSNKSFAANFASGIILSISVPTGRSYRAGDLVVGTTVYTDRTYQVTSVPAFLNTATLLKTANDDKTNNLTSLLSFDLTENATLYIAYDPRGTTLPAWMNGWQKLPNQIGVNDSKISYMNLYSKDFFAGRITLGGNLAAPASGASNNYFVIAKANVTSPVQYSLNVNLNGNGTVSKSPDAPAYNSGTNVILTATPSAGQQFTGWSGDATGNTNPLTIQINSNKAITANFSPVSSQFTLSMSVSGSGSISKNPDQTSYANGTNVTVTATPLAGQQFAGWSGDTSGTTNPLPVTMNASKAITANFTSSAFVSNLVVTNGKNYNLTQLAVGIRTYIDRTYTVTTVPGLLNNSTLIQTANDDKTLKSNPFLSFDVNGPATIYIAYDPRTTALPAWMNGWQKIPDQLGFNDPKISYMELYSKSFSAGTVALGGNLATPAKGALDNYFVIVQPPPPQPVQYGLQLNSNGNGTVTKNPDQATFTEGSAVSLTAVPASGFQFAGWSGDAGGVSNPLNVLMDKNKSISASFTQSSTSKAILFSQSSQSADVAQGGSQTLLEYISTSDHVPVSVVLSALDEAGNLPQWLSVNGQILNGISYTTGSEITFDFDATNLSLGTYTAFANASSAGYNSVTLAITLTVKAGTSGTLTNLKINFQDSVTVAPTGWIRDYGQAFGQRVSAQQGNGNVYGWITRSDKTPVNLTKNSRKRTTPADILLATLMHMQANDVPGTALTNVEGIWEVQVANGNYDVTVTAGDGSYSNSKHTINVEGVNAIASFVPTSSQLFKAGTVTVTVSDGLLTIDAIGGFNSKINSVIIAPASGNRPSVVAVNPDNGAQQVNENASISTSILDLPNGGIDNSTITNNNVYLTENSTGARVPANVNGTGGGDAITLVPSTLLRLNTTYTFTITNGVKDLSGASFISYSSSFTTGMGSFGNLVNAKFDKIELSSATGRHSSLTMGPDEKLYALSIDGMIKRFPVNHDGTLGNPDTLYSIQDEYGSRQQRLAIGFAFDPSATGTNLVAWVTHSSFVFLNGPAWDGKLTRLSGNNLENVQDVLINLPRSAKDHLTNSIAFGPDGKLYFTQGSMSAMGRADKTWGNRDESLLSGTVLKLDVSKLGTFPLDVKTSDGGGTYNPYAANAPLTIYASGVRNAYDLVWHSNGNLYVPTNGSAAGGNTPASVAGTIRPDGTPYRGPAVPALTNVQQTQKDFLFRVAQGGYYGHPNLLRGEYVMNGGNPTTSIDPAQVNDYPVGTLPDANWRGYAFDFQNNKSPNGAIEYKSNTFDGALKGKLLVVRYSQNDDIITLIPSGPNNDIVSSTDGAYIEGFSGFVDPLDLTEDTLTGNIYVSEYGGDGKIVLLRTRQTQLTTSNNLNSPNESDGFANGQINAGVSLKNTSLANKIPKVYPNPFHNKFVIQFPESYHGEYSLKIADISGKIYDAGSVALNKGGSNITIDVSRFPILKGVYFLRITSKEGRTIVTKLISQ